jgi:hypothetical protein
VSGCGSIESSSPSTPIFNSTVDPNRPELDETISPSGANNKPSLAFTVTPVYCCNPRSMVLEAQVLVSLNPDGVLFQWEFGDGRTGQGSTVEHTYGWPGNYVVTLEADFPDGTVLFAEQMLLLPGYPAPPDDDRPNGGPEPDEPTGSGDPVVADTGTIPNEDPGGEVPADPSGLNLDAIAQVMAGVLTTANAAWWGFDANDATHAIQSAINSGARTVLIPNVGRDWNVQPLFLVSNQEIVFEDGVVLAAKSGAFHGSYDCLLSADGVSNVILRGYNAVLRMRKADYTSGSYSVSEWRHVLIMRGVNNVQVLGLSLQSSGGDGIYVGPTWDNRRIPCRRIDIKDCVLADNFRQGISIVSAETVRIENCLIRDTRGTSPEAGIDFEPADASDHLVDIEARNCVAENNAGSGFAVGLSQLDERSMPVSVKVINCLIRGPQSQGILGLLKTDKRPRGTVEFQDCTCEVTGSAGLAIIWNLSAAVELRFDHCEWREVARLAYEAPIYMEFNGVNLVGAPGGIRFTDCLVNDKQARDTIRVVDDQVVSGTPDVTGTIFVSNETIDTPIPQTGWPLPELTVQMVPGP